MLLPNPCHSLIIHQAFCGSLDGIFPVFRYLTSQSPIQILKKCRFAKNLFQIFLCGSPRLIFDIGLIVLNRLCCWRGRRIIISLSAPNLGSIWVNSVIAGRGRLFRNRRRCIDRWCQRLFMAHTDFMYAQFNKNICKFFCIHPESHFSAWLPIIGR